MDHDAIQEHNQKPSETLDLERWLPPARAVRGRPPGDPLDCVDKRIQDGAANSVYLYTILASVRMGVGYTSILERIVLMLDERVRQYENRELDLAKYAQTIVIELPPQQVGPAPGVPPAAGLGSGS